MTRDEAHALLDAVRAGGDVTTEQIREALRATGDLKGSPNWGRIRSWEMPCRALPAELCGQVVA